MTRILWHCTATAIGFIRSFVSPLRSPSRGISTSVLRVALMPLLAALDIRTTSAQPALQLELDSRRELADDGNEMTDFASFAGVTRMHDGGLLVITARPAQIRQFNAAGRFVRLVARDGAGPNELRGANAVVRHGDTLFVHDGFNLIRFHTELRQELDRLPFSSGARGAIAAVLPGGLVLETFGEPPYVFDPSVAELRRSRSELRVVRAVDRRVIRSLGSIEGRTFLRIPSSSARAGFRGSQTRFAPQLFVAPSVASVWIGDSGSRWLKRLDANTLTVDSFPVPLDVVRWSAAALAQERARILRETTRAEDRELPLAEIEPKWHTPTPPQYAGLYPDVEGGLWIEEFIVDATAPRRIHVLDRSARTMGTLNVPRRFSVREIGRDYVIGTERSEDGLLSIVTYSIRRTPRSLR